MQQRSLFDSGPPRATFSGITFDPVRDQERLGIQLVAVARVLADGGWHTLADLKARVDQITGKLASEASISARLRDLRKTCFGGHKVERRHVEGGTWVYRMTTRSEKTAAEMC